MISKKLQLDSIDKKIISLIQKDPNMTHTKIAEEIDRSQPTVGMRIKKLENSGVLQFQPGINFKNVELHLGIVEVKASNPEEIMDMAKFCPFMLNAFRVSGEHNICIMLASSNLQKLDNVVNYHFRNNPTIANVSMEVVTEIAKDLILPIDFDSEEHNPTLQDGCGEKCKYRIAKHEGKI
ncbi:MAG: Lrp/AsnC family transcriptional regulator [Promethearchaeota archaeon]|nr:MAG: Lrp/AsnC family transcriptional regulator [Candidatus Lokiarchaeota archaeon]